MDVDRIDFIASYVHKRDKLSLPVAESIYELAVEINEADKIADKLALIVEFCIEHKLN